MSIYVYIFSGSGTADNRGGTQLGHKADFHYSIYLIFANLFCWRYLCDI